MENISQLLSGSQKVKESCYKHVDTESSKDQFKTEHVQINLVKLNEFATEIVNSDYKYASWEECHFKITEDIPTETIIAYVFLIDTINFCFWPTKGFEYDDIVKNLNSQLDSDPEFFTAKRLSQITKEEVGSKIFVEDFCLLPERARLIREVGSIIQSSYNESFLDFVKTANGSATKLVDLIIEKFPGFRDESITSLGEQIFFYKRAQILVGDLYAALLHRDPSLVKHDIDQLTMFPDYRVPQILHHLGIFEYSEALLAKIEAEGDSARIFHAEPMEIDIRAATVVCVEHLKSLIHSLDSSKDKMSIEIDWILWQKGEQSLPEMKPHHRTLSIFY